MSAKLIVVFVIIASLGLVEPQTSAHRKFREILFGIIGRTINQPFLLKSASLYNKIQERVPDSVNFPCSVEGGKNIFRSKVRPTSIHKLRPGDIDVIGAIGDSLTAGCGAGASFSPAHILSENRGVSWSIGGQSNWRQFLTLPNIIKEFNPNLVGYSTGDSLSHEKASQFNVAELAGMSIDLPIMVRELVRRIKNDPRVDVQNDWKLITIMMGANDFCLRMCDFSDPLSIVESHRKELNYTLRHIMNNLPRTFINIVPAPDVTITKTYENKPPICVLSHRLLCPCIHREIYLPKLRLFKKVIKKWQEVDKQVTEAKEFVKDDFTVEYQPFDLNPSFLDSSGKVDYSRLSVDCFHFAQKTYAQAANALWNNMMEPAGKKSTTWYKLFERFPCPSPENPYIRTKENSLYLGTNDDSYVLDNNLFKRHIN